MDHFHFKDGNLHCEGVALATIADKAGTPTFVYSAATLRDHIRKLQAAFAPIDPLICFSVKSCPNLSVLRLVAGEGCGMDVVSPGELQRALAAGVAPSKLAYAGVGKTHTALTEAISLGVGCLNVESAEELELVARVAAELRQPASLALRVNPDVDAGTHRHTTTGTKATKFGVSPARAEELFERMRDHSFARMEGLHLHIGSPVLDWKGCTCTSARRCLMRAATRRRWMWRSHSSTACSSAATPSARSIWAAASAPTTKPDRPHHPRPTPRRSCPRCCR